MNNYEPFNLACEESLIGAIMKDEGSDWACENIKAIDFYGAMYREYFTAILLAHSRNDAVTLATISDLVPQRKMTELGDIMRNTASSANLKGYAKIVLNKSSERQSLTALHEAAELIKGDGTTQEKTAAAAALTADIAVVDTQSKPVHIKQIASEWLDEHEARTAEDAPLGLKVGVNGLDDIYGNRGIGKTDMVVIGARPKVGKTQLLVMMFDFIARNSGRAVLIFSMEMPKTQLFERFLTNGSKVKGDSFYRKMDVDEYSMVSHAIGELNGTRLYIDDRPNLSMAQVNATAKKFKEEHGDIVVGLDYFTLMKTKETGRTDLAFGENSTGLKTMAKNLECPVVLLAQLSRGVDSRPNKRPLISDLRESGSIEQDADSIIFLYRDSIYNPDNGLGGLTENIVAANRHGETGVAFTDMKGGWFENVSDNDVNHMMDFSEQSNKEW